MNNKRIAKYTAIVATMFALLAAMAAYASDHHEPQPPSFPMPFAKAYAAQINATGTLTLKNSTGGADLKINTTFTSLVPLVIDVGDYANAEFHGFATALGDHVRLDGLMVVEGVNFWAAFAVDRPTDVSEGRYYANGNLELNITQITLPPAKITMVEMKGKVTKFGGMNVSGSLEANAKIGTHNVTNVHGSFTLQPPPKGGEEDGKRPQNFTVSFYIVSLFNATKTELNYDSNALYVEGFWNVYNRTVTVTHIDHEEETTAISITTLLGNATGKFNVTLTPQISPLPEEGEQNEGQSDRTKTLGNFTLDITGLTGIIKGDVIFYHDKFADPGDRDIPRCDFNGDHVVDIVDVSHVAKAFGAKYGDSKYESDLDLDGKLVIDITDVARAAVEFGQEY